MRAKALICGLVSEARKDEKLVTLPGKLHISNLRLELAVRGKVYSKRDLTQAELQVDLKPLLMQLGVNLHLDSLKGLRKVGFFAPIWVADEPTINKPTNKRSAWKISGGGHAIEKFLSKTHTSTEILKLILQAADPEEDWYLPLSHLAHGRRLSS